LSEDTGAGTPAGARASDGPHEDTSAGDTTQRRDGDTEAAARAAEAYAEAEALREQARALAGEHAEATRIIDKLREQVDAAAERDRAHVERYREALLRAEPALPPELLSGDTFDEIDAAASHVRALVQRVSETIARDGRAPAGAPSRRAPDTSGMSAEEKIRAGLSQRRA
jgi:hypothetical protein